MTISLALCLIAYGLGADPSAGDLEAPVRLKAADRFIDVEIGHAAPLFTDWDGDGLEDLLVGQFGGGKLLVYKNQGSRGNPSFSTFEVFQAGGQAGVIPSG